MIKFPTTELIRWLEAVTENSKIDLAVASPQYWQSLSLFARLTFSVGLHKTAWWRSRFLYQSLISALSPQLSQILHKEFTQPEEYLLEKLWKRLLEVTRSDQLFKAALEKAVPGIGSLLINPFPKFHQVRRECVSGSPSSVSSKRRSKGFMHPETPQIAPLHDELLCNYEARLSLTTNRCQPESDRRREVAQVSSQDEPHQCLQEAAQTKERLQQFYDLVRSVRELEKRWARVGSTRRETFRNAVVYRFEAPELLVQGTALMDEAYLLDDGLLDISSTLASYESSGLIKRLIEDPIEFDEVMTSLKQSCEVLLESVDKYQKCIARLQEELKNVRLGTQSHFHRLEKMVQKAAQTLVTHPYQALARNQINDAKGLLHTYERELQKIPGPTCQLVQIEETIRKNLSFIEMLAQNSER